MNSNYALHEMLEVHEMATSKTICLTKSKTMQILVTDPEHMQILQYDVQVSQQQLQELGGVLSKMTL
jgi:similar to spore coat protein